MVTRPGVLHVDPHTAAVGDGNDLPATVVPQSSPHAAGQASSMKREQPSHYVPPSKDSLKLISATRAGKPK